MNNKYKYILYVLLFIAITVLSFVALNFYIKYTIPVNEANRTQQEQLKKLTIIIKNRDKALLNLENEKNQEIIDQVNMANDIKDEFYSKQFTQLTDQLNSLQSKILSYKEQLSQITNGNENTIILLEEKYQQEIDSLTTKTDNYLEQINKMKKDYEQSIRSQKIQYEEKLVKAENDNKKLQKEISSLITLHEKELKYITNNYLEYIDQLIADITLQDTTIEKHEETISLLHEDIIELSETYDKNMNNVLNELFIYEDQIDRVYLLESQEIQQFRDHYNEIINKLQATIEKYKNSNELFLVEQNFQEKVDKLETLLQETNTFDNKIIDEQKLDILNLKNKLNQLSEGSIQEALSIKNSYEVIIEEIKVLNNELLNTNLQLTSNLEGKEQQIMSLIVIHEEAINQLENNHQDVLQRVESDYNEVISSQAKNYESQLTVIDQELEIYKQDYLNLKKNNDQMISRLQLQIEQEINKQINLDKKYLSDIKIVNETNQFETDQLIKEYTDILTKLQSEVVDYQGRLEMATNMISKEAEEIKKQYDTVIILLKQEMAFYLEQIEKYEETDYFTYQISMNQYISQINKLQTTIIQYENIISELEVANSTINIGSGVSDEKVVYLTFDDGPSGMTIPILDVLDSYNIKATFFVLFHEGYKKEYKEIYERGHTIGNHTYSHDYSYIYKSVDNFYEDMKRLDDYIYDVTGSKTIIMRFPGGTNSTWTENEVKMTIMEESYKRGYIYYDWNASAGDGAPTVYEVDDLVANATKNFSGTGPVFLLMHDSMKTYTTVDALDNLIEFYLSQGYTFAPITYETPQCKLYNQP
ncbi:MAG: polysaccharide deacetylase family protein [Clostridiales bacterium]|nr:polysaccharide deacetylase family protein [Clostridiales bacterium]